jgi:Ca-activated chloride channel homolog
MNNLFKDFSWQDFNFESYALLSLGLLVILFLLFEYFPGRNYFYSLNELKRFIDKHLISHLVEGNENRKRSWLRMVVISIIWVLIILALANPRWNFEDVESFKPDINLVILLDISKSMSATDEKPSRLDRAKQEIIDIIKKSTAVNIGIIVFANQAHIISPVTDDKNALQYLLPSVNTDLVSIQGSNIEAGLKSADLFLKPMKDGYNYILVMSDGGFGDEVDLGSFKDTIKNGKIITFGLGKTEGVPIIGADGKFIEDEGKVVLVQLEKDKLIKLAGLENYIQGSYMDDDTKKILNIISGHMKIAKQKSAIQRIWHDRFYIPLGLAALLLLPFFRRGAIFPAILIMLFSTQTMAQENGEVAKPKWRAFLEDIFLNKDQQAEELYNDRKYKEAAEKFSSEYNKGTSSFRDKDLESAERYFAVSAGKNISAEYNLGNAQLLQNKVKEAIATYESVLKKAPTHEDTKHNLEIAKKLLNNQKKQNSQSSQSENQPQEKSQDNKDQQSQGDKQKPESGDNKEQGDNKPQESDGNNNKKELDIQAKSILSKISSDPEKLIKARIHYEEGKGGASSNYKNPKPW